MTPHSPHTLPASLLDQRIAALPEDDADLTNQPLFTRYRQTEFLHALAACGVARRASAHFSVSYRTADHLR